MTGRKASVNKLGRGKSAVISNVVDITTHRMHICVCVCIIEEPMKVLWNPAGDKYAIMFDKSINIYNVAVSVYIGLS